MRRAVALTLAAVAVLGGSVLALTRAEPLAPETLAPDTLAALQAHSPDPEAGRMVFLAAGCGSCHMGTASDADPERLSGGQRFASDFGTFVAPNISPDPDHGIGAWDLGTFANAVIRGVAPDGHHYYPAFPYTAYAMADPGDIADLYAYIQTLPPDPTPSGAHDLAFPFSLRAGLGLWKARYADRGWVLDDPLDATEERGRYLVEALGHCAECHTPRDAFGGLDHDRWMSGAPNPSGDGRIPPIAGPDFDWSAADIAAYLDSGFTPSFDVAGGSMARVVASLSQIDATDRDAIAAYLLRLRD